MQTNKKEPAKCRGCGMILKGNAYMYGGSAYHPKTNERARSNYYGGFVCSRSCDERACLELEQSMPGHGHSQKSVSREASSRIKLNWDV